MFRMLMFLVIGLLFTGIAPMVFSTAPKQITALWEKWFPAQQSASDGQAGGDGLGQGQAAAAPVVAWEGAPVGDLAEVLRFDVTPDWVLRRWPRVTTGLAQLPLQGYRVPLVTGTAEADLAGSLTYYFNPQQQLQRITFHGTTGNAGDLVGFLTSRHKFARRVANDPGLFVYEAVSAGSRSAGLLKVTSVGVVKTSDPHRRFNVELSMERPG